jgi:hypothetical protein
VSSAARRVGPSLYRQEGVVKAAFGIVGFDHHEASRG